MYDTLEYKVYCHATVVKGFVAPKPDQLHQISESNAKMFIPFAHDLV